MNRLRQDRGYVSKRWDYRRSSCLFLIISILLVLWSGREDGCFVAAGDDDNNNGDDGDDYYAADDGDDYYAADDGDDYYAYDGQDDDYVDEYNAYDDVANIVDDYYDDGGDDDGNDDGNAEQKNNYGDDDTFYWNPNVGFEAVSVMPLSCINYNNGHVIKYQLFDTAASYQCHFAEIQTFVVSIAHYMRAYFNYQALTNGRNFQLPSDAAYLNCNQLQGSNYMDIPLYAKIGCMERETFTSTRLQLHVYTDEQCSQPYDDGQSARRHASRGYIVGDVRISSQVSFNPPFYTCSTCSPESISGTFNKKNSNWYDDDYISKHGNKEGNDDDEEEGDENNGDENDDAAGDDENGYDDDNYFDDQYLSANDDVARDDDDYYNRRFLTASVAAVKQYQDEFWSEYDKIIQRALYDNYYDVGEWNMCQRIYKYGIPCDQECKALDLFRTDQWSASDVFLLGIMVTFLTAMMLLIVAKRLKAQQKARIYGEDPPMPGLPPFAMAVIFFVIMCVIVVLAKLKFINETLVFAVVTCILLFIYMLKLTLFENRRPVLLAAPRHDMFDNPLDDHLFE